jgi:hypothetical protein
LQASGHDNLPLDQGDGAAFPNSLSINEMAFEGEVVVQVSVHRREFL